MERPIRLLLSATAALLILSGFAQNHQTFPNVSGVFTNLWLCYQPTTSPPESWIYETHTYVAEPSTEYEGLQWGALNGEPLGLAVEGSKVFFHTTDTWLIEQNGSSIIPLYDFSLEVGDTAYTNFYYAGYLGEPALVAAIDTIMILDQARRRFIITDTTGLMIDDWLEGIGSLGGLMRPLWHTPLGCSEVWYDYCAEYLDVDGMQYSFCTDIVMQEHSEERISPVLVYPNPASVTLTVQAASPVPMFYRLLDMQGQVNRTGVHAGTTNIDISDISGGMYLLHVDKDVVKVIVE